LARAEEVVCRSRDQKNGPDAGDNSAGKRLDRREEQTLHDITQTRLVRRMQIDLLLVDVHAGDNTVLLNKRENRARN
jgi:hypothetical protein